MAYVPYTSAARDFVTDKPERKRAGFFRRLANAIFVSRQRAGRARDRPLPAERQFTDEAEREIERRFFSTR